MSEESTGISVQNVNLATLMAALRKCGDTTVPMALAVRMLTTQKAIVAHMQTVQEVNNKLIEKYGEVQENGQHQVTPEMDGWDDFVKEANILNLVEFNVGEPYILYHRDGKYGWSDTVKTPIAIAPNVLVDMGDLLVIAEWNDPDVDDQIAGHIEPEVE